MISKARGNTTEFVYQQILNDIQQGNLRPGAKLTTESLAQRYDVSRTPVREALVRLERDGFVAATANAGYEIRTLTLEELCELYEIREELEGLAVMKLTQRGASPELIAELRKCCEQRRSTADFDTAEAGERKLHMLICESCGSEMIRKLVNNYLILSTVFNVTRFFFHDGETKITVRRNIHDEHARIVDAIEAGNSRLAGKLLKDHIAQARKMIQKLIGKNETAPQRRRSQ